jgi:hypothetical protein
MATISVYTGRAEFSLVIERALGGERTGTRFEIRQPRQRLEDRDQGSEGQAEATGRR